MIQNKQDYKDYLKADMLALGIKKKPMFTFGRYQIYKYEKLLRKCEYYLNCKNNLLLKPYILYLKWLFRKKSIKYGFEIPLNCFGKGLSIAHIGPIVINGHTKIGENCRIHICVNIGTQAGYSDKAPILGNNIYIAPGAKLFGKITIADNIVIGANSVVNKSFLESGVSIAGVPAKVISHKGRNGIVSQKS